MTRFDLQQSLFERVQYIFRLARDKIAFRWGRSAELYAAACIYIAARENRKELTLLQLAVSLFRTRFHPQQRLTWTHSLVRRRCREPLHFDSRRQDRQI